MSEKKKNTKKPRTHEDLRGFNIHINEFGQVESTLRQDQLNRFLNENVTDKKFNAKILDQIQTSQEEE